MRLAALSSSGYRPSVAVQCPPFGPLNVTRAVLPVMRAQRSGHVITFSSTAGLAGQEFVALYCASKFAIEGWMESLRFDLEPYGINPTIVEPGFFRTELLVEGASTNWPELSIEDDDERTRSTIEAWKSMNGKQGGDPAKLAAALITIAAEEQPPLRWLAGADAVRTAEDKARLFLEQADAYREQCSSLAHTTTSDESRRLSIVRAGANVWCPGSSRPSQRPSRHTPDPSLLTRTPSNSFMGRHRDPDSSIDRECAGHEGLRA